MLNTFQIESANNNIVNFLANYHSDSYPVYLFGLGGSIDAYIKLLKKYNIPIECIIDNNISKHGSYYSSIPVYSPETLKLCSCAYIVISAPSHIQSIKKQISDISNSHIIVQFDPSLEIIQNIDFLTRKSFYLDNYKLLEESRSLYNDEKSKNTFDKIIEGALRSDIYCYNDIATDSQYFPDIIRENLSKDEIFLDVGAYTGDSSIEFIKVTGNIFKKIIGFEPKRENIEYALSQIHDPRVEFYPYGLGQNEETLYLYGSEGLDDFAFISNEKHENAEVIEIKTIDGMINEAVSFIKMDIEGMEIPALLGGQSIIKNCHPKLAISVYHKIDDLIKIPETILSLDPTYKLYLRHYWKYCGTDSVIFAI